MTERDKEDIRDLESRDAIPCSNCCGTGECPSCCGHGDEDCPECDGTGECPECDGFGDI